MPDTDAFKPADLVRFPDLVPVPPPVGTVPGQEPGVKAARALPYVLHADAQVDPDTRAVQITFGNDGTAGAVFQVRSADPSKGPWTYTLEPHTRLTDAWTVSSTYALSVYGPNGFFRGFTGSVAPGASPLDVQIAHESDRRGVRTQIVNTTNHLLQVKVGDVYAGKTTPLTLGPGDRSHDRWPVETSRGWYDLMVSVSGVPGFEHRFAGHLEDGEDSISDPLMGGLV